MTIRKILTTGAMAALMGIGTLAATSTSASAYTVCNRYGDCWHQADRATYPGRLGVRFYGDDWRGSHHWNGDNWRWNHRNYHWRADHEGRGYWRNGIWITL